MKNILLSGLLLFTFSFFSCNKDDDSDPHGDTSYQISIMSPNTDAKHVGDNIHIHVDFSEKHGGIIHHINVKIFNKSDAGKVLFDGPDEAHVHEANSYAFHADVLLDSTVVEGHSDWIMEAKVWGHEDGEAEEKKTLEFHVHPM